jgi:hypothetical protein
MDDSIGTNLKSITDKSINALSAENLTSGSTQPTLGLINGRNGINFNGANSQFLNLGNPSVLNFDTTTISHTLFFVVRSGETTGAFFGRGNSTDSTRHLLFQNTTTDINTAWGGTASSNTPFERNMTNIICWEVTPTTQKISINGTEVLSTASGTTPLTNVDLLIGARRNSGNTGTALPYTGVLGEMLWYKRTMSQAEKNAIYGYLNTKWRNTGILLVIGASLEEAMKDGLQKLVNITHKSDWTIVDLATGGENSTQIRNRIDTDIAPYANKGAYAYVHHLGNSISQIGVYRYATESQLNILSDNTNYIFAALQNANITILPANISFRTYDAITNYYPEDGSLPYYENILKPKIDALNSPYVYNDGTPYLDLYRFVQENINNMADEVHLTPTGYANYRQFVVDTVMKRLITGVNPTQYSPLPLPSTPAVTLSSIGDTELTATWTMSSETNVVGYAVEHKCTADSDWIRTGIVTAPTKTLLVTGLLPNTSYDIRVKAAFNTNAGEYSTVQTATTTNSANVVLVDSFTDANDTLITAHTSDSLHTWVTQPGFSGSGNHARIWNNALYAPAFYVYRANVVMSSPNYRVIGEFEVISHVGNVGLTARNSNVANSRQYYEMRYQDSVGWTLRKWIAGNSTSIQLDLHTPKLKRGDIVTAELRVNGTSIKGFLNGVEILNATDSQITSAGSPGLSLLWVVTAETGIHFRNVAAILL